MSLASGDRLGSYTIFGRGGTGEVYLAADEVLKRQVAIKVVHAEELSNEAARRRLMNEARAAARLEHPHICPVFEVGVHGQAPFIVMPFIEGETLAARVGRSRLSPDEAIDIGIQIASVKGAFRHSPQVSPSLAGSRQTADRSAARGIAESGAPRG